jgi:hypothetical protein
MNGVMRLFLAAGLLVVLTASLPAAASACSCEVQPSCQAYWKTEAVFDGTVVSIESVGRDGTLGDRALAFPEKLVTLAVRKSWKGVDPGDVEVLTASQSSACGFDFRVGARYLVFAHRRPTDGRLGVSLCSNTRPFDRQEDTGFFLASLSQPPTGGRVFGSVRTAEQLLGPSALSEAPFEAQIRLSGGGKEIDAPSRAGRYEFRGLAPGTYRLDIALPEGYSTYAHSRTVDIPNDRACAQEDFSISPAGRILGRLFDVNGRPLAHVLVEVTTLDARPTPYGPEALVTVTGTDGDFVVEHLSPGRYIVGVNLRNVVDERHPYPKTFYPRGDSNPEVIELALGQTVQLAEWRLPPANPAIRLRIQPDRPVRYP